MYRRSTRAVALADLPASMSDHLARHAAERQLELRGARAWITHSENPPGTGLLAKALGRRANPVDPDAEHHTAVLLHSTHLVVATLGEKRGVSAVSLPLAQASVTRGSGIAARFGVASEDSGITVSGFPGEAGRPGTYFVGLGADAAGAECAAAVEAAIVAAKNPR